MNQPKLKAMKKALLLLSFLSIGIVFSSFKSSDWKFLPTTLKVTVLDELGNPVQGCKVTLYLTENDYREETNPVGEGMLTDEGGVVRFKKLEPVEYYVHAIYEKKTNIGAGVKTQTLQEGKTNRVNTVIR